MESICDVIDLRMYSKLFNIDTNNCFQWFILYFISNNIYLFYLISMSTICHTCKLKINYTFYIFEQILYNLLL